MRNEETLTGISHNPIRLVGTALAASSFATIVFLKFVGLLAEPPAYLGIVS